MNYTRQLIRTVLTAGLVVCGTLGFAQGDPPARVANLSQIEGTVAFAPSGETEWADAALNRPITSGDRLWTDRGSRAELQMGSSVIHMDGQSLLDITALDDDVLQASLSDGTVNARVRELQPGENFEIDTPQFAFRATQPGDFRIDVDRERGITSVVVHSGAAVLYGASGQPMDVRAGQQLSFTGQSLEMVPFAATADNGFDRWAQGRNRAEDQSVTARYVPRDVVGYQQLDAYGSWSQDPSYGAVWYPSIVVQDWAPYRYGHWDFIAPWGWTWIDDAPWGFAPFHYGRWAQIGPRWAWVPGRLGPRPVYAPALVAFVGGNGGVSFSFSFGSSPGIGWFPLAPGEAWRPTYHASAIYLTNVNRYVGRGDRNPTRYLYQERPNAWTSVRVEDFNRGRPVNRNWQPVRPSDVGRAQIISQPAALPPPRRFVENHGPSTVRALPPPQLTNAPGFVNRSRPAVEVQPAAPRAPMAPPRVQQEPRVVPPQQQQQAREQQPAVREPSREQREQQRVQREQLQQQRQQQQVQERAAHQQQVQEQQMQRQQQQQLRQQQAAEARQREHEMAAARRAQPAPQPPVMRPPQMQAPQVQLPQVQPPQVQHQAPPTRQENRERGKPEQGRGQDDDQPGRGRGNGRGG